MNYHYSGEVGGGQAEAAGRQTEGRTILTSRPTARGTETEPPTTQEQHFDLAMNRAYAAAEPESVVNAGAGTEAGTSAYAYTYSGYACSEAEDTDNRAVFRRITQHHWPSTGTRDTMSTNDDTSEPSVLGDRHREGRSHSPDRSHRREHGIRHDRHEHRDRHPDEEDNYNSSDNDSDAAAAPKSRGRLSRNQPRIQPWLLDAATGITGRKSSVSVEASRKNYQQLLERYNRHRQPRASNGYQADVGRTATYAIN